MAKYYFLFEYFLVGLNGATCSTTAPIINCKTTSNFACTNSICTCTYPYVWTSGTLDCSTCATNYVMTSPVCCK